MFNNFVRVVLLLGVFFVGACSSGPAALQSRSGSQSPTIDGSLAEWEGALSRLGDRSISMNVLPTDSLLYVVFSIRDPELLRAVAQKGLTVWVDPKGRRRHAYGVRYPIGLRAQRVRGGDSEEEASRGTPFDRVFPSDLAVLRNDTLRHRVPARFSTGPRVAATLNTGSLLYELGIPVHSAPADDRRHGLRSSLSRPFSVGLETPESDDSAILKKPSPVSVTGRGRRTRSPRRRRRRRSPSISDQDSELPSLSLWKRVVWGNGQ